MILPEVPDRLYVNHLWILNPDNRDKLGQFLHLHGIEIKDAVAVTFSPKSFEVVLFERDERGRHLVDPLNEGRDLQRVQEVPYLRGQRPRILKEGRRPKRERVEQVEDFDDGPSDLRIR